MRLMTAFVTALLFSACFVEPEPGDPGEDPAEEETEAGALAKATPKVEVCHIPPGNPANAHTIWVGQPAVAAHLGHGDTLGPCDPGDCVPTPEVCGDAADNDCDGNVDEGCVCPPGEEWDCYSYPLETDGIGTCQRGTKTCNADGSGYGACVGEIGPEPEICGDGLDNDCNHEIDDGCATVCAPGSFAPCYTGPAFTEDIGVCHGGTMVCAADGSGYGACGGQVTPSSEVCGDGLDNDCDGLADEGCLGDRAWNDLNRNGVQDAGEPGLAGATFFLRSASTGGLVQVAVSGVDGSYWFSNVFASTYYIEVVTPPGFTLSDPDQGGDTVDSDFDSESGGVSVPFPFGGGIDDTWDAGFYGVIQS